MPQMPGMSAMPQIPGMSAMPQTPGMSGANPLAPGGGSGGGTLLDEMKKKGSLFAGDYGTQFQKVLEKTYGTPNKGLSITLNPMDTMTLMSGLFQGMNIADKQPYETAGTFSMATSPKTALPESELSTLMNYGQNVLQVQQQLATFMKDLLTKAAAPKKEKTEQGSAAPASAEQAKTNAAGSAGDISASSAGSAAAKAESAELTQRMPVEKGGMRGR